MLLGPKPPDDFKGDGCTSCPDGWWREACRYHDWAYRSDVPVSRFMADCYLLCNLWRLGCPFGTVMWSAVRIFGGRCWRTGGR